jgi:YD repeat-containing protein
VVKARRRLTSFTRHLAATIGGTLNSDGTLAGGTADFTNTCTYDNFGRLTSVTQSGQSGGDAVAEKRVDFSYDADNQVGTITQYADLAASEQVATGTYTYDHGGNLTDLTYTQPNSTRLPSYTWSYDADGQVTQMVSADGTVNYTNDATGQLTAAATTGNSSLNESHSYDSNGNRTDTGYTTGTDNRLLSDGTFTYTYLCPCQPTGAAFCDAFPCSGTEERVGGAGGGASSPCSPARCGRKRWTQQWSRGDTWQDAPRACLILSA